MYLCACVHVLVPSCVGACVFHDSIQTPSPSKAKSKKKKKKKKKTSGDSAAAASSTATNDINDDEVERSIQEVNTLLGVVTVAGERTRVL